MKLLEGKTAIVTGAARGIGKAIALKFAAEGCNIAFTDLVIDENGIATEKEIEKLDEIIGGSPYGASTIAAGDGSRQPTATDLDAARFQGRHVAEIAAKLAR